MHPAAEELGLELKRLLFPKISIEANPTYKKSDGDDQGKFQVETSVLLEPGKDRVHVTMNFSNEEDGNENKKYSINMQVYSYYSVKKDLATLSESDKEAAFTIIGTILLGSLREMICSTTARSPWGTYLLPSVDISSLVKNLAESISVIPEEKPKKKTSSRKTSKEKAS